MYSLRFLGGARLLGVDAPVTGPVAQRHRLALLALLARAQPNGVSRDKLVAFLWPERDSVHARNLLKQAVHALRRTLGEDAILAAGDELRLAASSIRSDIAEFEDAVASGAYERATSLYEGPFLDGFFLRDAPEFERWVEQERSRLAGSYAKALEALAVAAEARGDYRGAADGWKALAAHDRYDSRVVVRLMRALVAGGNRAAAVQYAEVHERLLQEDLGVSPSPDVATLREQLRHRAAPGSVADISDEPTVPSRQATESVAHDAPRGAADAPMSTLGTSPDSGTARRRFVWRPVSFAAVSAITLVGIILMGWLMPRDPGGDPATVVAAADLRTVAVLPFINLSRDPAEEYFSDGLTEELIGVLSQVRSLRVVARTSAFAFKGEERDVREIGRSLGAGTLVEGSVRRDGDRVRVTAQLINAKDGLHLWSQTYERRVTDLFAIQTDLAARIASALEAQLTPEDRVRLARRPTENQNAHADYLKGRHYWNQRTGGGLAKAIEYFERAIAADSGYAAAYAGLAMAHSFQGLTGYVLPEEAKGQMRAAAQKAVELDDANAEAHAALGAYLNLHEWNTEASERAFQRAMALDPGYGTAWHLYGNLLLSVGRIEDAVIHKRRALELDPLVPAMSESLGSALLEAGRPDEALPYVRSTIDLDSTYWRGYATLGVYHEVSGNYSEAVRAHERALALVGASTIAEVGLARNLALAGRPNDARRWLAKLQAEAARTGTYAPRVASVFLALNDTDGAMAWLERSYAQRHPGLRLFSHRAAFDRLRTDPRFLDLLKRVGVRW